MQFVLRPVQAISSRAPQDALYGRGRSRSVKGAWTHYNILNGTYDNLAPQWPLFFVLYDRSEEVFWRDVDVEMDFFNVRLLGHLTIVVAVLS